MNLGAFLVVVALRRKDIIGEDLDDMAGLMHKSPGYAVADADLHAVAGGHSADRRVSRQVLHLPGADRDATLRAGGDRRRSMSQWRFTTISGSCAACSSAKSTEKAPLATSMGMRFASVLSGALTLASDSTRSRSCGWLRLR